MGRSDDRPWVDVVVTWLAQERSLEGCFDFTERQGLSVRDAVGQNRPGCSALKIHELVARGQPAGDRFDFVVVKVLVDLDDAAGAPELDLVQSLRH